MNQKGSLKEQNVKIEANEQKNDFLNHQNDNLGNSKLSKGIKNGKNNLLNEEYSKQEKQQFQSNQDQLQENQEILSKQKDQQNLNQQNQNQVQNQNLSQNILENLITHQNSSNKNVEYIKKTDQNEVISLSNQIKDKLKQMQTLLIHLRKQLHQIQSQNTNNKTNQLQDEKNSKINVLQQQIQVLQIKIHLHQKMQKQKQLTSIDRINHLDHIFKHYCTHIFKTGKHMTFDRLEYEKVHLTIDRFFVFLKDFNLTSIKTKDQKIREIIEKQEVIKLFKKVSPNCRDLNFQQFIIMIEKLGEIYFDSKLNYEQRKINQRKERLKIKQNLQKKEKYKQQMLKKHKQKMKNLQRVVQIVEANIDKQIQPKEGENDNLIEQLMKQKEIKNEIDNQVKNIGNNFQKEYNGKNQFLTDSKVKKSISLYTKSFKKQPVFIQQKKPQNPLLILSKHEKREYFYQVINVDDVQTFMNKLRQLNLPLFKIYTSQKDKDISQSRKKEQRPDQIVIIKKQQQEQQKRLKQLRKKLNERNQKIKNSSMPLLSKQQYEERKLKRSRMQQQNAFQGLGIKDKKKSGKIDITNTQINLESLSKLNIDNLNFKRFDPRNLFSKEDDDKIFLKEYEDSPTNPRKLMKNFTQLSRVTQNTKRVMEQKDKSSSSFLQKLKQRQSQVEINQKKQQISQLYRLNDRTQRQKRLVDKFLQKNR